ncbi:haloacid dehalogenase-like hydrolase domain-containing protein Sgpp [Macadamia integrifolia]|uniref:haloacid dehalogenase-like hydrolase domain-containing protein Sgpp n=1 Tax=Macadamia integrifolia TaxID=60698 RepID=UPI001C4E76AA|nr:haloacid dehalogenase-like hydrolase domain-containing protein Sgpp [Macadamia integrifolia]
MHSLYFLDLHCSLPHSPCFPRKDPFLKRKNLQRRTRLICCSSPQMAISSTSLSTERCSLSQVAPLEAVLFDIDGTICDSDPIHYLAFREMLLEIGFNGGVPIDEDFYVKTIAGKHNPDLCPVLFPDWDVEKALKFLDDKEAMFRRLAPEQLKPVDGLHKLCKWIKDHGFKRAAVTNAPRPNAELMISLLGLSDFFDVVVIGSECERAKPFPDPYLKGLEELKASANHCFVFEDSASGIKAGVAAEMPVVGITTRNPERILNEAGATFLIKDYSDPKLWSALEELDRETVVKRDTALNGN